MEHDDARVSSPLMASYYLCSKVPVPTVSPGKLVRDTDTYYAALTSLGALLWPSSDPVVAAAALLAQAERRLKGASQDDLQAIMFAGAIRSLRSGGGGAAPSGAVLVGSYAAVPGESAGVVLDLTSEDAEVSLPDGTDGQTVTAGFVGTDNGNTGVWTSSRANISMVGYSGLQATVNAGQVGGAAGFTYLAQANGGLGLWLRTN